MVTKLILSKNSVGFHGSLARKQVSPLAELDILLVPQLMMLSTRRMDDSATGVRDSCQLAHKQSQYDS